MYAPLFAGVRMYDYSAMFFASVLVWRRVVLVAAALFLADHPWLQAMLYMAGSLANMSYLGYVLPFDTRH